MFASELISAHTKTEITKAKPFRFIQFKLFLRTYTLPAYRNNHNHFACYMTKIVTPLTVQQPAQNKCSNL